MRMIVLFPLFILLMACAVATAQEQSVLAQLQRETRAVAAAAQGATVVVTVARKPSTSSTWPLRGQPGTLRVGTDVPVSWRLFSTPTVGGASTVGVLVGSPPKVVVPYAAVGTASSVEVRLPDGKQVIATRLAGHRRLGVALFGLSEEDARGVRSLKVRTDWKELGAGTVAIAAGGNLEIGLVREVTPMLGQMRVDGAGPVLLGIDRSLLGLRMSGGTQCGQCHAGSGGNYYFDLGSGAVRAHQAAKELLAVANRDLRSTSGQYLRRRRGAARQSTGPAFDHGFHAGLGDHTYLPGPVIARVLADVEAHGRVRFSYLGVVIGESLEGKGVRIGAVLEDSPAAKAGLKTGAIVAEVNGMRVEDARALSRVLLLKRPGDELRIKLAGPGKALRVILGDRAEAQQHLIGPATIGLRCMEITPAIRALLDIDEKVRGVLVKDVLAGSAAAKAGVRKLDVIWWGGEAAVADLGELRAALATAKDHIVLRISREGKQVRVTVPVRSSGDSTR